MKVSIALFALAVATLAVANPVPETAQAAQADNILAGGPYIRRESAQAAKAEWISNGKNYIKRDNADAGRPVMYRRKEAEAASAQYGPVRYF